VRVSATLRNQAPAHDLQISPRGFIISQIIKLQNLHHYENYYVCFNQKIDPNILPKHHSKFDAVPKCKKVKGDLLSCNFWSQNSIFRLSTLATSDFVVQLS